MTPTTETDVRNDDRPSVVAAREPGNRRGGKTQRVLAFLSALGPLIGVVTGAVGTFYLLRPNLAPSTANEAHITNVAIEPGVTLGQYARHPTVARVLGGRHDEFLRLNAANVDTAGTVVHFDFKVVGYNRREVTTRWTLFDAETGRRIGESEQLEPLAFKIKEFEKKDADIGSWESWVHSEAASGRPVFVRLELFDGVVGLRLVFRDTPQFVMH